MAGCGTRGHQTLEHTPSIHRRCKPRVSTCSSYLQQLPGASSLHCGPLKLSSCARSCGVRAQPALQFAFARSVSYTFGCTEGHVEGRSGMVQLPAPHRARSSARYSGLLDLVTSPICGIAPWRCPIHASATCAGCTGCIVPFTSRYLYLDAMALPGASKGEPVANTAPPPRGEYAVTAMPFCAQNSSRLSPKSAPIPTYPDISEVMQGCVAFTCSLVVYWCLRGTASG